MIREYMDSDLNSIMKLWLDTNVQSHNFIPEDYWKSNYAMVKEILPKAELYLYEDDDSGRIDGFIGLTDDYIAGIFVRADVQSRGIGKQLLDYVKALKSGLSLSVYQKNGRAVRFYERERFVVHSVNTEESTQEKEYHMIWNRSMEI